MADLESQITGLSDLQKLLDRLPTDIERKLMRGALRAGQKVVLEDAQRLLDTGHSHTEQLANSLRISTRARGGRVMAVLKAGDKDAFYAHMVEFGTDPHLIRRRLVRGSIKIDIDFVGPVVHHPGAKKVAFMRQALDSAAVDNSPAFEAVKAYLARRINKELDKLPDEADGETR